MNKTTMLLVTLIIGAMSGCIELKSCDTPSVAPYTDSVYDAKDISEYLKSHNLTVGFGELQITLHSDKSVTVGNETGYYVYIGSKSGVWSCAVNGIADVEYLHLHTGRSAVGYNGNDTLEGYWFRDIK